MKSSVCYISNHSGMKKCLELAEKTADYCNLEHHAKLQLRLLTEEMMGMLTSILGRYTAQFFIEEEDNRFELHLRMVQTIDKKDIEKIISASSDGKNQAHKGFMGMIRSLVESWETVSQDAYIMNGAMGTAQSWTLASYRSRIEQENEKEAWDELEKSIMANIADDVLVTAKTDYTEIIVKKRF